MCLVIGDDCPSFSAGRAVGTYVAVMKRLTRAISAAALATAMAVTAAPAIAQDSSPAPTMWVASIPPPVSAGSAQYVLPGDLMMKKSRGDRSLGKVSLVDVVEKLERLQDKGRSVGGNLNIRGRILVMKGLPTIKDDGTVKVRVVQGRGTRSIVVPRMDPKALMYSCPPGQVLTGVTSSGQPICS